MRYLLMSTNKTGNRYDEDFKRTLVNLYQSGGKSQAALCKEYGISATALRRWIKQYKRPCKFSRTVSSLKNL